MKKQVLIQTLSITLIILLLTACGDDTPSPPPVGVDIRFREFHDLKGGAELLGKPVSGIFNQDNTQQQIFENGIIVYKPSAPPGEQFDFLKLAGHFITEDSTPEGLVISGQTTLGRHVLYDEFTSMFNRMGGVRFVGYPLTSVRRNDEEARYEQYFEKLGFYRQYSDPPGQVHLLPYGLFECHRSPNLNCNKSIQNAIPEADFSEPLLPIMKRLGELPGKPLSQVYLAPDGKYEQVYENIVLAFDVQSARDIELRPLSENVGLIRQPLVAPIDNDEDLIFWEIENKRGYNVPREFLKYIAAHGSTELSGPPISEIFDSNGLQVQCFTNYCLTFDSVLKKIQPTSLGYQYLKAQNYSTPKLEIHIWEDFQYIEPGKTQVVNVTVYNQDSNTPISNVQPTLTLTLEDQTKQEYVFPPTSQTGASTLKIAGIQSEGLVVYEVCVTWPGSQPVCVRDSWIVR